MEWGHSLPQQRGEASLQVITVLISDYCVQYFFSPSKWFAEPSLINFPQRGEDYHLPPL